MSPQIADYGTWKSPITAEILSSQIAIFTEVLARERDGNLYYLEAQPWNEGRKCIMEHSKEGDRDILPKEYSALSRVHEYGGAALAIGSDGILIFTDSHTAGVFSLDPDSGEIQPLLEPNILVRFANFDVHPKFPNWILAVREDHRKAAVENCIVAIDTTTKETHIVAEGADFYAHPKFSHDGERLCWTEWYFPDMPWTGTELFGADWQNGKISNVTKIAGKARYDSISQPRWSLDGTLYFVSDKTGFWQLYKYNKGMSEPKLLELEGLEDSEFSHPEWFLGVCTYELLTPQTLVAACTKNALTKLVIIDISSETYKSTELPLMDIMSDGIKRVSNSSFTMLGRMATTTQALYLIDVSGAPKVTMLRSTAHPSIPDSIFSAAQHISFKRKYGEDQSGSSYCIFNPPHNPDYIGPSGKLPPLILSVHGGPTLHTSVAVALKMQYWSSRGYAVAQLNFSGSSSYGRAYRDLLNESWGLIDIADAASCASHLAAAGLADGSRTGIRGGSGGGYAVLQGLCSYPDIWRGGVSEYGVSELKLFLGSTHKFESQYLQQLLFKEGTSVEKQEKILHDRSPYFSAQKIKAPLLLLQGTEDKIVPPNQAQEMENIIKKNGGKVKVIFFPNEGHGFRIGRNIWRSIEEEEKWWSETLLV